MIYRRLIDLFSQKENNNLFIIRHRNINNILELSWYFKILITLAMLYVFYTNFINLFIEFSKWSFVKIEEYKISSIIEDLEYFIKTLNLNYGNKLIDNCDCKQSENIRRLYNISSDNSSFNHSYLVVNITDLNQIKAFNYFIKNFIRYGIWSRNFIKDFFLELRGKYNWFYNDYIIGNIDVIFNVNIDKLKYIYFIEPTLTSIEDKKEFMNKLNLKKINDNIFIFTGNSDLLNINTTESPEIIFVHYIFRIIFYNIFIKQYFNSEDKNDFLFNDHVLNTATNEQIIDMHNMRNKAILKWLY